MCGAFFSARSVSQAVECLDPALQSTHAQEKGGTGQVLERTDDGTGDEIRKSEIPVTLRKEKTCKISSVNRATGIYLLTLSLSKVDIWAS